MEDTGEGHWVMRSGRCDWGGGDGTHGDRDRCTHVLLQPELLGDVANLLQGGLWALQEQTLQVASHSVLDTRPLSLPGLHKGLCLAYLGRWGDDKERNGWASPKRAKDQYQGDNDFKSQLFRSTSQLSPGPGGMKKILERQV